MNDIFAKLDISKPLPKEHDCVGIFSPEEIKTREQVIASRGEFAGYFVEDLLTVVLFRDRLGARNLYYAIMDFDKHVYISTDLEWLASKVSPLLPNEDHIKNDYLHFQLPFSDSTFFRRIKKVMPGEMVTIRSCGNGAAHKREKYWEPEYGDESFDANHLTHLVADAVDFRLSRIEGPYTSYLSGGIDSSSMTVLARPDECFSGFYTEEGYSELGYIESVVELQRYSGYNLKYNKVEINPISFHEQLQELASICPEPSCGLGIIPQVIVAKKAAEARYRYAFTGEGGDEVFTGYNWNRIVFKLAQATRDLHEDRYMVRYDPMIDTVLKNGFPTLVGGLLARHRDRLFATERILGIWRDDLCVENNILNINLTLGLPAILTVDEQVGRFAGVEPVSPIMDHKIVEYICSLRPSERGTVPKQNYREAMKLILPEKIRTRYDKMGFPVPYKSWTWPSLRCTLESLVRRKIVDFDIDTYQTMNREAWALFNIEMWHQKFVDDCSQT